MKAKNVICEHIYNRRKQQQQERRIDGLKFSLFISFYFLGFVTIDDFSIAKLQ
jgi:hypothetical protein